MIRSATEDDLPAIDNIYNQAVNRGFVTAHMKPLTSEKRMEWFRAHPVDNFPVYVFEEKGEIQGWVSLSKYRQGREAVKGVAEISFYVDFNLHNQNIGSKLVDISIRKAPVLDKRIFFAVVIEGNEKSMALLKSFGFERWGYLPEVINFQGEKRGHIYMGKKINF